MGAVCTVILVLLSLVLVLTLLHHAPVLVLCMNCSVPQPAPVVAHVSVPVVPTIAAPAPEVPCATNEFNPAAAVSIPPKEEFGEEVAVSIPKR